MHCCLWFRSVFRVRGPWPKRYGYHLSIVLKVMKCIMFRVSFKHKNFNLILEIKNMYNEKKRKIIIINIL